MMLKIGSSGDMGIDRQFRDHEKRLIAAEKALAALVGSQTLPTIPATPSGTPAVIEGVHVQDLAATTLLFANTLEFDTTNTDFSVAADGENALIGRTATAVAPAAVGGSAAAGSSQHGANADHVHAGVTSLNALLGALSIAVAGNLASVGAAGSTVTITVRVPRVNADPGSPVDGDVWYRTDLDQFCIRTGGATLRSPVFT